MDDRDSETRPPGEGALQQAIGRQIREFRTALGMTVAELGRQSELSAGAISKIERGLTPPSLTSLSAIAGALAVPVTALFRKHEEQRDASYVEAGKGLVIERRGTRVGHRYELLGHTISGRVAIEPYLVTLTEESEVFPLFQHAGIEFIHLLEGEVVYRAAGSDLPPATRRLAALRRRRGARPRGARAAAGPHAGDHLAARRRAVSRRRKILLAAFAWIALLFGAATLWQSGRPEDRYAHVLLLDPKTGKTLHGRSSTAATRVAALLSGGRVAVATLDSCPDGKGGSLTVFDATLERVVPHRAARALRRGAPRPGRAAGAARRAPPGPAPSTSNTTSGHARRTGKLVESADEDVALGLVNRLTPYDAAGAHALDARLLRRPARCWSMRATAASP